MKLSQLNTVDAANQGEWCEIVHPVTGKTGVALKLLGQDGRLFRERMASFRAQQANKSPVEIAEASEIEAMATRIAATVAWRGLEDDDGKPLDFTPENVKTLYETAPIARDQADLFMGTRSNFLPKPLKV